jgi:PhnB protein
MGAVQAVPQGYHSLTPAITCKGAAKAIDFYKQAFGATEKARMEGPGGMIMHAEILIGDSPLMLGDEFPGMSQAPNPNVPPSFSLNFYTDNVDSAFDRAVKAGCKVVMPLQDQFWGDRYGKLQDPFGHTWGLLQHIEDVPMEEMERRGREWTEKMAKAAGQS